MSKKANAYGIKISTFGVNKKSDICLKKIVDKGRTSKILIKTLKATVQKNDKILFKGSRSMKMDNIIEKVFNI